MNHNYPFEKFIDVYERCYQNGLLPEDKPKKELKKFVELHGIPDFSVFENCKIILDYFPSLPMYAYTYDSYLLKNWCKKGILYAIKKDASNDVFLAAHNYLDHETSKIVCNTVLNYPRFPSTTRQISDMKQYVKIVMSQKNEVEEYSEKNKYMNLFCLILDENSVDMDFVLSGFNKNVSEVLKMMIGFGFSKKEIYNDLFLNIEHYDRPIVGEDESLEIPIDTDVF